MSTLLRNIHASVIIALSALAGADANAFVPPDNSYSFEARLISGQTEACDFGVRAYRRYSHFDQDSGTNIFGGQASIQLIHYNSELRIFKIIAAFLGSDPDLFIGPTRPRTLTPAQVLPFVAPCFDDVVVTKVNTPDLIFSEAGLLEIEFEGVLKNMFIGTDALTGIEDVDGPVRVKLTVDGGVNGPPTPSITFEAVELNIAPVADAGEDVLYAVPNLEVYLDGTASSDEDGDMLTYSWTQISGDTVTLSDVNSATPSFFYPPGPANQNIEFELIVNDGTIDSEPDTVAVIHKGRSKGNGKGKAKGRNK